MTEHPLTGPNRKLSEDTGNYTIPFANVKAAIEALGFGDDINDLSDITLTPKMVTLEFYERDENGAFTTRFAQHGRVVNSHTVTLDIDKSTSDEQDND